MTEIDKNGINWERSWLVVSVCTMDDVNMSSLIHAYACVCVSDELGRRGGLQQQLMESRDMSASRASLSILDDDSTCSDNDALHHQHADDDDDDSYKRRSSRDVRQSFHYSLDLLSFVAACAPLATYLSACRIRDISLVQFKRLLKTLWFVWGCGA